MPRATFPLHRPPPWPHHWSASLFLAQLFSLPGQRSPQHLIRSFSLLRSSAALPSDYPFSSPTSPQSGESFTPSAPSAPSAPSSSPRLRIHSASSKRNSSYWSPEDDSLLLDLRHKGQPWHQIGQALGRSRQACNRRFNAVLDPDNGKPFWARHPEMNVILETLVAKRLGWNKIADYIGINASSCEKQWRELKQQQRLEQQHQQQSRMQADATAEGPQDVKRRPSKQRPFRRADVELLKAAVAEHGNYRWDSIAETVFQSRYTVHHLRYQYTKLERRRQVWTLQQEATLLQVAAGLVPKDQLITPEKVAISDSQWDAVADTIQGEHTGEECRRRWLKLQLTGSKRTGKGGDKPTQSAKSSARLSTSTRVVWTAEQSLLLESIIQDIKDNKSPEDQIAWKVVSDRMGPGFSKAQCKSRWNRMTEQSALSKTGRWNSKELEHLFSGLLAVGPAWTEIHRDWLPGRSPKFIHGKWKQILSRVSQDQVIQRLSWQDACVKSFGSAVGGILDQAAKRWPNITTDRSKSTE